MEREKPRKMCPLCTCADFFLLKARQYDRKLVSRLEASLWGSENHYTPHFDEVRLFHTQIAGLKCSSVLDTRKLMPLEFTLCVWACVLASTSESMRSLRIAPEATASCVTGSWLTRRLSV